MWWVGLWGMRERKWTKSYFWWNSISEFNLLYIKKGFSYLKVDYRNALGIMVISMVLFHGFHSNKFQNIQREPPSPPFFFWKQRSTVKVKILIELRLLTSGFRLNYDYQEFFKILLSLILCYNYKLSYLAKAIFYCPRI